MGFFFGYHIYSVPFVILDSITFLKYNTYFKSRKKRNSDMKHIEDDKAHFIYFISGAGNRSREVDRLPQARTAV